MAAPAPPRRIVIGIGNPARGDDMAGRLAVRLLCAALPGNVAAIEHDGEAADLVACFEGADAAFLIDACTVPAPAGSIYRFDAAAGPLPHDGIGLSTHGLGLAEAIELARVLGRLPPVCIVYAIAGASFAVGAAMSAPVAAAAAEVARRLIAELAGSERAHG